MKNFFRLIVLLLFTPGFGCHAQNFKTELNVSYGTADGQKLLLDIYEPTGKVSGLRPAMIVVHGGAWSAGDKEEFADISKALAGLGYVTFSINYRLVTPTTNKWPAQLDDCQRAVRWVRAHASQYGIDPARIGALGGSAGGHLVACLGTMETRDNSDKDLAAYSSRVTCVVDMAGPTDFTVDLAPQVAEGAWTNEQIAILLGTTFAKNPGGVKAASPLFRVDAKSAPELIVHGRKDTVVPLDQAQRFADALKKAGVEAKLLVLDCGHGFEGTESLALFLVEMQTFLAKQLHP